MDVKQEPRDEAVPSPCIGACKLDAEGQVCTGCHRTLDEIAGWSTFHAEQKRQVWARLLALPLPVQAKACPCCGKGFTCGAGGTEGGCWCADLPCQLSPSQADSDCLCPACLQDRLGSGA